MPQSPNYERLRDLAELAHADQPDHAIYEQIQESLTTLEQTVNGIRRSPGFIGEIRDSINTYLNERIAVIQECAHHAEYLHDQYTRARDLISQANTRFGELITHLNTPAETRAVQELHVVDFNGEVHMSQLEHNQEVARQRNEEREKAALAILDETNEAFSGLLIGLPSVDPIKGPGSPAQGDGSNSTGNGSRSHAPSDRSGVPGSNHAIPRSALPSSALIRPLTDDGTPLRGSVVGGPGLSPTDPPVRWVPGPGGSIRPDPTPVIENPEWPRDALTHPINARLTPQGPVGGYLPPGIHIDDPRWRDDYHNPALGGSRPTTPNAAIVNGTLTTGAAAAAARGLSAIPAPGTGASLPGHPVGVLPPGTAPTHGGTLRPAGSPAPTNTSGATGARTAPGAWHAPHAAGKDEEKEKGRRSLVGYDVTRLDPEPEPVDPSHFAAGDVTTLTPAPPDPDKDDDW
ncbi:hypothetical protein EII34_06345 [Arachnia propionica]|uniref:Uncharacterized protein n=1 Tax=Arachnia propionica TaxID=1750 RepID=A0A3P1T7N8_9ACTN|nr:hypothetical protein [Arachnia propionica]RRD05350.1 hypothetical protein EII34_06345 [Arachnia propionica]